MDCIFCKIIKGEIPCYKIYEDENVLAFLDISNDIEGHTLVIPKKHYKNILDCKNEDLTHVIKVIKKISNHYISLGYNGVNVLNNNEKCAEQSVFHLHFHILPRKDNDGYKVFPDLKSTENNLTEICEKLKISN